MRLRLSGKITQKRYPKLTTQFLTKFPKASPKKNYICYGGPWDTKFIKLTDENYASTLEFNVGGHRGRYVQHPEIRDAVIWEDATNGSA